MEERMIDVNELLKKVNIVDIVKQYLNVIKKGKNYYALCPFHNDSNPSLVISEDKQIFKCFVCNTGGNVINFVQKKENISYRDALIKVAEFAGYDVSKLKENKKKDKFYIQKQCMKDLNEYYNSVINLNSNSDPLKYCEDRGLNYEIRKKFNIGYSPKDGAKTLEYLKTIKDDDLNVVYSIKTFQENGICSYKNGQYKDINEDRITFGLCNNDGEIVGFSSRYFKENRSDDIPKYMNTKETSIFHKSEILYNYYRAKEYAHNDKFIYIVEGFMDVIAFSKAGINSCVGLMGTAFSDQHVALLKKLNCEVRIFLDNDNAGQTNTLLIINKLNKSGLKFKVVKPSNVAKDSDEILNKVGEEQFKEIVNDLLSQQDYLLEFYKNKVDFATDIGKKDYIYLVFKEIINLTNSLEIEEYCKKIANLTGFSKLNVEKEYYKYKKRFKKDDSSQEIVENPIEIDESKFKTNLNFATNNKTLERIYRLENLLIKLILQDDEIRKYFLKNQSSNFINPTYNDIYFFLTSYMDGNIEKEYDSSEFLNYINENSLEGGKIIFELSNMMFDTSKKIDIKKVDSFIKDLEFQKSLYLCDQKISSELNEDKKALLIKEKAELLNKKRNK